MCGTTLSTALALISLSAAPARAVTPGTQNGNMIVPDGRTATSLSTSGRKTTITTSTLSGGNAYNSFSTFTEAAGNTVNLVVPGKANELVNLVRNGAVDIEGVLNSYKNGALGGNIIFADSYGFVVGKSGVVNTGSLSVVTPTADVMNSLISAGGVVDPVLGAQIVSGNVPVSPDGSVSIRGLVNAAHAVLITAHDVEIAGSFQAAAQAAARRALFEAAVNVNGLVEGGRIAVRDGSVQIVATDGVDVSGAVAAGGVSQPGSVSIQAGGDVSLSGSIIAGAVRSGSGGSVQIVSGADMSVAATAAIRADGQDASGGQIRLYADDDLDVADGATFSALGRGAGAGGKVELSAAQTATIGQIDLQLSATSGVDGSLLIDPNTLVVDSSSSIFSHGASITLTADSSITLENGGALDSRDLNASGQSIGDSGAISLSAPTIAIQSGGQILAGAVNGPGTSYASGAVTLTATATAASGGVASIAIGDNSGGRATVSGGDLLFQAIANLPQT
ncbi:MAG TPA: leukotoxin LktA family filamentous adhesin, partial [Caulobacteraceae bacterium]|nr:leukotoxin LktA family filamentous adhesin [Caulobacteraceae bacterium]